MNIALILAGGMGNRSGLNYPKQYYKVHGKPIIAYTLEKFQKASSVDEIYVICSDEWSTEVMSYKGKYNITKLKGTFLGGATGLQSVQNGLRGLTNCGSHDFILLHDAVRPFVDTNVIEDNLETAHKYGNAMAAVDCVETLVFTQDGLYSEKVVPRDGMKRIQTPQTFQYGQILSVVEKTDLETCKEPSAFSLWMSYNLPIYCSKGNEKNIKITYPEDIEYFTKLFE